MSPLDGSTLIYKRLILPFFLKNKTSIEKVVNQGKELAGDAYETGEFYTLKLSRTKAMPKDTKSWCNLLPVDQDEIFVFAKKNNGPSF